MYQDLQLQYSFEKYDLLHCQLQIQLLRILKLNYNQKATCNTQNIFEIPIDIKMLQLGLIQTLNDRLLSSTSTKKNLRQHIQIRQIIFVNKMANQTRDIIMLLLKSQKIIFVVSEYYRHSQSATLFCIQHNYHLHSLFQID